MKKFFLFLTVILLLTPFVVAAQTNACTTTTNQDLGQCVSQIYIWSLGVSGILAVSMVVFGGYMVMTARGNGAQASKGKTFITSALAGMVLLLGAYLLLNTINPDLADFNVKSFEALQTPAEKGMTPPSPQPTPPPGN